MICLWTFEKSKTRNRLLYRSKDIVHIPQTFGQPEKKHHFQEPLVAHLHSQKNNLSEGECKDLSHMIGETRAMIGENNLFSVLFLSEKESTSPFLEASGVASISYEDVLWCLQPLDTKKMEKDFGLPMGTDISEEKLRHTIAEQLILQRLSENVSSRWIANINLDTSAQDTVPDHWKASNFYSNPLALMISQIDSDTNEVCIDAHSAMGVEMNRSAHTQFDSASFPFFQAERVDTHSLIPRETQQKTWTIVENEKLLGISSIGDFLKSLSQYQLFQNTKNSEENPKKQKKIHFHYPESENSLSPQGREKIQRTTRSVVALSEKGESRAFRETNALFSRAKIDASVLPSLSQLLDQEYVVPNERALSAIVQEIRQQISNSPNSLSFSDTSDFMGTLLTETLCPQMEDPRFDPYKYGNQIRDAYRSWMEKRESAVLAKTQDHSQKGHRPVQGNGVSVPKSLERAYTSGVLNIGNGKEIPRVSLDLSQGMEPAIRERREKVQEWLKTANVVTLVPYVKEPTAGEVTQYARDTLGGRRDRVYSIDNNRGMDEKIQKKIGENSYIIDRNAVLNTLDWDRISEDFHIPQDKIIDLQSIVNDQPRISGSKGIALYSALIEMASNPDINDDTMVMFIDSDYENTEEYNPLLHLGNGLLHAEENKFHLNGVNMAKAGAGRNNVLTHYDYNTIINDAFQAKCESSINEEIQKKNQMKFALGVSGASTVWPHSDAFSIRWGVLKNMPIAQDMDFEHVAKTFLHVHDAFEGVRRFWQVANDSPKKECGMSNEMREWLMMKGLGRHLKALLELLEKHNYDYASREFLSDFNKFVAGICALETYIPDGISGASAEPISCSQGYLLPSVTLLLQEKYRNNSQF